MYFAEFHFIKENSLQNSILEKTPEFYFTKIIPSENFIPLKRILHKIPFYKRRHFTKFHFTKIVSLQSKASEILFHKSKLFINRVMIWNVYFENETSLPKRITLEEILAKNVNKYLDYIQSSAIKNCFSPKV